MPIKIELLGSALKISLIKFKVSWVPLWRTARRYPPYIPHFSMSLEGGQFSRSNFWEIFLKISCYPPKKIKYFAFV